MQFCDPFLILLLVHLILVSTVVKFGVVARVARHASVCGDGSPLDLDSTGWTYRVVRGAHPHHLLYSVFNR